MFNSCIHRDLWVTALKTQKLDIPSLRTDSGLVSLTQRARGHGSGLIMSQKWNKGESCTIIVPVWKDLWIVIDYFLEWLVFSQGTGWITKYTWCMMKVCIVTGSTFMENQTAWHREKTVRLQFIAPVIPGRHVIMPAVNVNTNTGYVRWHQAKIEKYCRSRKHKHMFVTLPKNK